MFFEQGLNVETLTLKCCAVCEPLTSYGDDLLDLPARTWHTLVNPPNLRLKKPSDSEMKPRSRDVFFATSYSQLTIRSIRSVGK